MQMPSFFSAVQDINQTVNPRVRQIPNSHAYAPENPRLPPALTEGKKLARFTVCHLSKAMIFLVLHKETTFIDALW
jgi:hypothetical protein